MSRALDSNKSLGANSDLELGLEIASGTHSWVQSIHKFGSNEAVSTSFVPVTQNGVYRTPQVGSATALRIKAGGDAADDAAGNSAREITLIGLDAAGAEITETLATAGVSASSNTSNSFIRLYRVYVSKSGSYATQSSGSHVAAITIENATGTEDWAVISATGFPHSQSEIAAYSVPLGCTAYVKSITLSVDATKTATVLAFQRKGILDTSAPYEAMRLWLQLGVISGEGVVDPKVPFGPFPELTDIGFLAKLASGTGQVDIDFEILLVKD